MTFCHTTPLSCVHGLYLKGEEFNATLKIFIWIYLQIFMFPLVTTKGDLVMLLCWDIYIYF